MQGLLEGAQGVSAINRELLDLSEAFLKVRNVLGVVSELVDPSECCFGVEELPEDLFAGFAVDACVRAIVWGEVGIARALNTSHWLMRHTPYADVSTIALDGAIKT